MPNRATQRGQAAFMERMHGRVPEEISLERQVQQSPSVAQTHGVGKIL